MADPARRRLRVQLLKDLVSNGLYRVDTGALAEKLMSVLKLGRRQR
jgi:anti-sigma28 factor (negative regulator of flagellin synthesis)